MSTLIPINSIDLQKDLDDSGLDLLLDKLFFDKGYDFRGYKKTSIRRRIKRRMHLNNISAYEKYMELLDSSPVEYQRLFDDLTIRVTGFFRDIYPFYVIRSRIIPDIINNNSHNPPLVPPLPRGDTEGLKGDEEGLNNEIRIWCPGCATGEEPYSIGMLLSDVLKDDIAKFNIKIFGTDINETALESARLGIYDSSAFKEMKEEYKNRHFFLVGSKYRIKYSVRQLVRYGIHSLVRHTPISHLDILLCRNVLIYFDRGLQEKALRDFYYALKPNGYLILGKSEVIISEFRDVFKEIDREARIYQKKG
ncbi:MAG: protein-glutamate O-methyltransferase CheR [Nitrospirae bacterium]|nr:protein-glutamate O-methyltransferase CheR [Nitrospirota bacterium]